MSEGTAKETENTHILWATNMNDEGKLENRHVLNAVNIIIKRRAEMAAISGVAQAAPKCVHVTCDDPEWCAGEPKCRYTDAQRPMSELEDEAYERGYQAGRLSLLSTETAAARTSQVALWMMDQGYATGHGDTLDDMLGELVYQVHANALLEAHNVAQAARPVSFMEAMDVVEAGFKTWREKLHNAKWWKRIDGTPIANDLSVNIAEAICHSSLSSPMREGETRPATITHMGRAKPMPFVDDDSAHSSTERAAFNPDDIPLYDQAALNIAKDHGLKTCLDEVGLQIVGELYRAVDDLKNAPPCLLGLIGSWGDTLDDSDVLAGMKRQNEMGECFIPAVTSTDRTDG